MTDLSIIFGTYNRLELLKQCVESIRRSVGEKSYEIVITEGGSTDGSQEWLAKQLDCSVEVEKERRGAVAAFNDAYRRSVGRNVMALNDDVEVLGDALSRGVDLLDAERIIGQLAFAFSGDLTGGKNVFRTFPMHRHAYANLGMLRRTVVEQVVDICGGLWNPIYHTYGGDTELSCWVWRLGWEVRECMDLRCIDHLAQDPLRAANNSGRNQIDGRRCHERWPDHACIDSMGPEPRVEPHELAKLRAWEDEKRLCEGCEDARRSGSHCYQHGWWGDAWARRSAR